MTDKERVCMSGYKHLAEAVIQNAIEELDDRPSLSASEFFRSYWFAYLCKIAAVDYKSVRSVAYKRIGFCGPAHRRSASAIAKDKAVARGKKRHHQGRAYIKLLAIPPDGDPFAINGFVNAAKLLGCSPAAVKIATDQHRPVLGWTFKKRMEVSV